MKSPWKQFAASGTGSEHKVFLRARLKLTGLYVLILAVIVIGFSLFLYQSVVHNLADARDDDFSGVDSRHHFVDQTLTSVEGTILLSDSIIIFIAALLSYLLAGETLKPIRRSLESQRVFAAQASHELRTPLTIMKTDIEASLKNISRTKQQVDEVYTSNLEEIDHLTRIAENLLVLARADNHILPVLSTIDLVKVISGSIARISPLAKEKNVRIDFQTQSAIQIYGDEDTLTRAILNILQNSLDHTPNGGSISIEVKKEHTMVTTQITDTGSGIDPKDVPHVFERFYKGAESNNPNRTGLGLSIVKEIIEQHKGTLAIDSIPGKGTTIKFHVPFV